MKKGFTLIELLVVVLIIGILSAIAVPQYTNAVEKARLSEALSMIGSLKPSIDTYVMANGYPSTGRAEFVGELVGNSHVALDVDAEASADCPTEGGLCSGKHFQYYAYCHFNQACLITATRLAVEVRGDEEINQYYVQARKDANGWTYICESYSKIGDHICKSLQTQGWRAYLYLDY